MWGGRLKGLIIAAGFGSRLNHTANCKPLSPLLNEPLIDHVIGRASLAGIDDFTVVTGHESAQVESHINQLKNQTGLSIDTVRTEDWTLQNGHSVLTGLRHIADECVLLMADHLFDPENCRRLMNAKRSDAVLTLAIDRNLDNPLVDLKDVTRVATTSDGCISSIGKLDPKFDAFDTGLFHIKYEFAQTLELLAKQRKNISLTEGVRFLAGHQSAYTVDIKDGWWIDIDTPQDLEKAKQKLKASSLQPLREYRKTHHDEPPSRQTMN